MSAIVNFTPTTYTAGMVVTDAQLTQDVNNSWANAQAAYATYTPTLTNITLGNGTLNGYYRQIGKTIDVIVSFAAGSTTTYAAGGAGFSLPVTPLAAYTGTLAGNIGVGSGIVNPAGTRANVNVVINGTPVFQLISASGLVSNTSPATFGTGSFIGFTARYMAA